MVSEILPEIKGLSVRRRQSSSTGDIVVSSVPEREDVAIPLSECGTGVGHVIAMAYFLFMTKDPKIILIDEPQSFLHPGAVRRLISRFRVTPQHQVIVTTHSPEVISAADPTTITLVYRAETESLTRTVELTSLDAQRSILSELGASLADVFGADNVLWVEGATEEICFPRILGKLAGRSLSGTVVRAVRATGDMQGKHARAVIEIYQRLTTEPLLFPPALAFIFDREKLSDQAMVDLRKLAKGRAYFLHRRMLENYLIHPRAIQASVQSLDSVTPRSEDDIRELIEELRQKKEYFDPPQVVQDETWVQRIDGARLLEELYWRLYCVKYQKTRHSVALADWLIQHQPEELNEILELLRSAVQSRPRPPIE